MAGLVQFLSLIPKSLGWRFRLGLAVLLSWVLASSAGPAALNGETSSTWENLPLEFLLGSGLGLGVSLVLCGVRLCAEILELPWSAGESEGEASFGGGGAGTFGVAFSWLAAVIFVSAGGHLQVISACRDMVHTFPPGSRSMYGGLVSLLSVCCQEATCLALRLAAPIWGASAMAMLVVAVLGRMFPVVSVVSAAIPWRAGVAWLALALSIHGVTEMLRQEMGNLGTRVGASAAGDPGLSVPHGSEVQE
jgi:flagellar biosynthetic protein FliR